MKQDEIIEMARQTLSKDIDGLWLAGTPDLEAFAKLVAAKEREACALVSEDSDHVVLGRGYYDQLGDADATVRNIAAAIRARAQAERGEL